jgi:hypothetical protein
MVVAFRGETALKAPRSIVHREPGHYPINTGGKKIKWPQRQRRPSIAGED